MLYSLFQNPCSKERNLLTGVITISLSVYRAGRMQNIEVIGGADGPTAVFLAGQLGLGLYSGSPISMLRGRTGWMINAV